MRALGSRIRLSSITAIAASTLLCLSTRAEEIEQKSLSIRYASGDARIESPMDITEDVIAYDGEPARWMSGDTLIGTLFAVRFTPAQACSLTYVTVASYQSPGPAILHVYGDNEGQPGDDLIDPFEVNLSGNLTRQRIDLPAPVDVADSEFHVGVEYAQTAPPFVTLDNDGGTGRSMIKRPGQEWQVIFNNDLNFRAFVRYYGNDQTPPTIVSEERVLGFSEEGDHPITAVITDDSGILSATVMYSTDGEEYLDVSMENNSGDDWIGYIPAQPPATVVYYYLAAVDDSPNQNEALLPPDGPSAPFVMTVIEGAEMAYDDGSAEYWYVVGNQWDENKFAVRFTPLSYPVTVTGARVMVNDVVAFDLSINDDSNGLPGEMLAGPFVGFRNTGDWAITFFPEDQWTTIPEASFWLVFHWREESPDSPAVGTDGDDPDLRSSWYSYSAGWNAFDDGDFIMRVIITTPTGISDLGPDNVLPDRFELLGNYPNPFNPSTEISFNAPRPGHVRLEIFNIVGQKIKTLYDGIAEAGFNEIRWDGETDSGIRAASGIYFCRLIGDAEVSTLKMTLLK
jgi:hypothetical protein